MRHYSTRQQTIPQYTSGLTPYRLRRVSEYIEHHLERDLSLSELAGLIDISPYHFARMFKQSTGVAPHHYVLERFAFGWDQVAAVSKPAANIFRADRV